MKKKLVCIMVCMLIIVSAMTTIITTFPVKGAGGHNQGINSSNPLNMTYIWNITGQLVNVTYKYPHSLIPRGRSFGSWGANYTVNNILMFQMDAMGLNDVHPEKIKHINRIKRNYTTILNVTDFQLEVYDVHHYYPYANHIPKNESFAIPSAYPTSPTSKLWNYNYNFTNISVIPLNMTDPDIFGNIINYDKKTITDYTLMNNESDPELAGNVTYLSETANIPNQKDQYGRVYLLNDSSVCQNQLDNLTTASGCIIINQNSRGHYAVNTTRCSYSVINVSQSEGLSIKNLSTNYSLVLSDIENGTLVFNYNFTQGLLPGNYSIMDRIPNHIEIRELYNESHLIHKHHTNVTWYFGKYRSKAKFFWWLNSKITPQCRCFILFDTYDQHFMSPGVYTWDYTTASSPSPALPTYTINNSVGENILYDRKNTTVTGWLNQVIEEETPNHIGVTAYNVLGNITIPNNPEKKIAIISNRYDGMWGQTPGDSGVGGAIVLGIAKYFKDNNIIPKYNLTFLFTTGEEFGLRGAYYYNDFHPTDNIKFWFVLDELAFNQSDTWQEFSIQNTAFNNHFPAFKAIVYDSYYTKKSHYHNSTHTGAITGTEQAAIYQARKWSGIQDVICIAKDQYYEWDRYHRTGENYTQGDSLKYTDRNDTNYTAEIGWNISKYFLVNPNCHFKTISYEATNSTCSLSVQDSIKTTFTVKSNLPNDKVMVNVTFIDASTGSAVNHILMNYTTNRDGIERNLTFNMPSNVQEGDYYVTLEVYNSTARINRIADTYFQGDEDYHANDSSISEIFHLNRYHSLGDIRVGTLSKNVNNVIRGSKFTPLENALVWNITAYVSGGYNPTPTYQCLIYKVGDGQLMGASNQAYEGTAEWKTFTFSPKLILLKNTQYMLCIWGNSQNAHVYTTPMSYANSYQNSSCIFDNPPQHITWDMVAGLNQLSIFCRYTLNIPPEIINVSSNPDTVGFGYNVTINANVTDDYNNTTVKVNITYPNHLCGNYTMSHITGNQYRYVFTNTWLVGQYNYTVWAIDNASNVVSSAGHHLNVTANASISIATLKDSYTGNQYINITDPPNPPNNLTLTNRGLTWNTYYNASSGDNILESYQGPVNYQENNGSWTPINNSFYLLSNNHPAYNYGYRIGNTHGLFGVYFKPDISSTWPVAFAYNKSSNPTTDVIRSKLVGVGYLDPQNNWAYHYLQSVQSSQGQTNGNTIIYPGVFTGTDVSWSYRNTELKEAITMSNTTKTLLQNHPPSMYGLNDASSYLVFITKLDYQNLNLYNSSGMLTGNVTVADNGVDFKDVLGQFKCGLPLGEAWERNNESVREKLTYRLVHLNDDTYLLSGLKVSDLNAMMFPVVIDPTLTVYSRSSDGHINKSDSNYNTARTASSGTVSNSASFLSIGQIKDATGPPSKTYSIYRGFVFFNTSSLPSNAYLDSAKLSLYKKDDFSATDFDITIQNGQPTYPHEPMQSSDYNLNYYSGNGGTLNTRNLQNGYNNISLTSLGWINKNGITKLCLRSNRDINNNGPTGNEYVNVYANEQGIGYQPKLTITYRNQSKIKNTGSTNIKGYLLIQVQFYNATQGKWLVDKDTINETSPRAINSGNLLALDTIFNGHVRASDLTHGAGTYRVFTALQDPNGNILRTSSEVELKAWWQFIKT